MVAIGIQFRRLMFGIIDDQSKFSYSCSTPYMFPLSYPCLAPNLFPLSYPCLTPYMFPLSLLILTDSYLFSSTHSYLLLTLSYIWVTSGWP